MFRGNQGEFPHGDCVVVAHAGAAKLDNASIRSALSLALSGLAKRAGGRLS
jgi:RNase P protein component